MVCRKIDKDRVHRFNIYSHEPRVSANKFVVNSPVFSSDLRVRSRYLLFALHDKYTLGHNYQNRCLITGHPRVSFRKFRISRMEFRRLAKVGFLKGLVKSSW